MMIMTILFKFKLMSSLGASLPRIGEYKKGRHDGPSGAYKPCETHFR